MLACWPHVKSRPRHRVSQWRKSSSAASQLATVKSQDTRNAGITLKSDPHDTEWKSRAFEVNDPSGFLLTIFSETSA
jgi:hypothetical protein